MATVFNINILWSIAKDTFTYLNSKSDKGKTNIIEAHKATYSAFIKTYDYLKNKGGENVPNVELAEAWNQASAAVLKVDVPLGNMLYSKSRFWLDPDLYFNLGREDEVIELKQIVEEMEKLRLKLK